jgi:hypothetical protein
MMDHGEAEDEATETGGGAAWVQGWTSLSSGCLTVQELR